MKRAVRRAIVEKAHEGDWVAALALEQDEEVRMLRGAAAASISHCKFDCAADSYCGQCEPLFTALKPRRTR